MIKSTDALGLHLESFNYQKILNSASLFEKRQQAIEEEFIIILLGDEIHA